MDNRVILQVPMSKTLRERAEDVAQDVGFSSLQDVIRLLLHKFAKRELTVKIEDMEIVKLSSGAKKRLAKIESDIEKGKNIYKAEDAHDFLNQLRS